MISVDEISLPKIKDDEILVKMGSTSLCHSDLMMIEGSILGDGNPVTSGHEGRRLVRRRGCRFEGVQKGKPHRFLYIKGCCCRRNAWAETALQKQ